MGGPAPYRKSQMEQLMFEGFKGQQELDSTSELNLKRGKKGKKKKKKNDEK